MKRFVLGVAAGVFLATSGGAFAYSYPSQVTSAFQDGQTLLAASLEELRQAVNGLLGLVDGSGNVLPSRVATGSTARFVTDAQVAAWNAKYDSGSSIPYARIATGSSADFITSAERVSWNTKLGSASPINPAMIQTGASYRFVTDAQVSSWNSKLDASAVGVSAASLSGGLVPLAQLPPVFDTSGLNVLAASVATNAGARFVSDAEKATWGGKLDSSSAIPAANVLTGASYRFATDAEKSAWNSKLGASDLGVSVAPLSGGLVPAQYLPSSGVALGSSVLAYSELVVYQAQSPGFVVAVATANSASYSAGIAGYSDASDTPNVLISSNFSSSAGTTAGVASITFPVRAGDYWKVATYGNGDTLTSLKFIPFQ